MNHITEAVLSQKVKVIPVLCYSRVSGYFAYYESLNKGKKSERDERVYYKVPEGLNIDKALNYKGDYNARSSGETGLQQ